MITIVIVASILPQFLATNKTTSLPHKSPNYLTNLITICMVPLGETPIEKGLNQMYLIPCTIFSKQLSHYSLRKCERGEENLFLQHFPLLGS